MTSEPLRVLIVDDSRIFRSVLEEAFAGRVDVRIVGSVWSGEKALEFARQSLPDFVTLDIEMPGLGGLATLRALRTLAAEQQKTIGVLLVSSHTRRGAAVTIEGLQEGAFDFLTKPEGPDLQANLVALREQLSTKLDTYRTRRSGRMGVIQTHAASQAIAGARDAAAVRRNTRFRAVVIGASTGGPEALAGMLPAVAPHCPVPIFLVQHLPPDFTGYFSASLARRCGSPVVEAHEGMIARPGQTCVAPGGRHLLLHSSDGQLVTRISDAPPENGCRPAVDVLFRSAALACSGQVLAVVLTGMGNDGAKGALVMKRAGAHVIVQDEATSVVWGMPGSTLAVGAADEVLPIDRMGAAILSHLGVRR